MKTQRLLNIVALSTFITFLSGCGKEEQGSTTPAASDSGSQTSLSSSVSAAVAEVKENAQQAVTEVKQSADKVVADVKQTTQDATAAAESRLTAIKTEAQGLIDKTKALMNDQKYQDAMASLKQLSSLSLTPEQQKTVTDLKAQLEKLMSSQVVTNAAGALNNLLKK